MLIGLYMICIIHVAVCTYALLLIELKYTLIFRSKFLLKLIPFIFRRAAYQLVPSYQLHCVKLLRKHFPFCLPFDPFSCFDQHRRSSGAPPFLLLFDPPPPQKKKKKKKKILEVSTPIYNNINPTNWFPRTHSITSKGEGWAPAEVNFCNLHRNQGSERVKGVTLSCNTYFTPHNIYRYIIYSVRDKSWQICHVISHGKSVNSYPVHLLPFGSKKNWRSQILEFFYRYFSNRSEALVIPPNII